MPGTRALGKEAEDRAAQYLLSKGYTLVTRRYSGRGFEVDIIAMDGNTWVFVEVKSRQKMEDALTAVSSQKAKHLFQAAVQYQAGLQETFAQIRFDLVAVTPDEIKHEIDFVRMG